MLLAEDLLILLVPESSGELPRRSGTQSALAAALLIELESHGRITVADDMVCRSDPSSVNHVVLDTALSALADAEPVLDAVARVMPGLYVRLLDRLAEQGVLTARARNRVPLGSKYVWRVADTTRREQVSARLAAVLAGHKAPTPWSGALIALLYALNAVDEVTPGPAAMRRAKKLSTSEWPGSAVVHPLVDRSAVLADFIPAPDLF